MNVFKYLEDLSIEFLRFDHSPVYTCDEANELNPDIPGVRTKTIFLRDQKAKNLFLVLTSDEKSLNLKKIAEDLNVKRLSFGSAERLQKHLGTTFGSVSILDLINEQENLVQLVFDREVWDSLSLQCHPCVNTSTLVIKLADIKKLIGHLNKKANIVEF